MGFKHILRETIFMSTIFKQQYFPWVHKRIFKVVCLAWEKNPKKKPKKNQKKSVGVPKFFVAVIEHPMTIGIQPMLHEQAHMSLLMF
jgi:hypothetical protein